MKSLADISKQVDTLKGTTISEAQTQLQQAFQGLASSYQQTFGKLDCG